MDVPENFAQLLAQWDQIKDDIALVRQLSKLTVLTARGEVKLKRADGAENVVLDLTQISSGVELPDQTGHQDQFLKTSGSALSWANVGATKFTSIHQSTPQNIPNGSGGLVISFDTALVNDSGLYSAAQPTRITFDEAGLWHVYGSMYFNTNSVGLRLTWVRKNGTTIIAINGTQAVNGQATNLGVAGFDRFAAGDYIELACQQWSGGNLSALAGASMKVMRVGA